MTSYTLSKDEVIMTSQKIGTGTYSDVFCGQYNGLNVALKRFRTREGEAFADAILETSIMMSLDHSNIVKCYGYYVAEDGFPVIVMEKGEKSLALQFREENLFNSVLTCSKLKSRSLQLCNAVKYLHDNFISHGDISFKNVIVSSSGEYKLCDFGFSCIINGPSYHDTKHLCTPASAAPELLASWDRTLQCDIYSLGIILLELLLRSNAFSSMSLCQFETDSGFDKQLFIQSIIEGYRPHIPRNCPKQFSSIIGACLEYDGMNPLTKKISHRPRIDEVIEMLNAWEL